MDDIDPADETEGGLDPGESTLVEPGALLLLDDLPGEADGHYCEQSLSAGAAADRAELRVRFPEDELDRVGVGTEARQPAKRGTIAVGDVMEAAAASEPDYSEPVVFDAVRDPSDLRAIATRVSRACEAWANRGYRITVCFDSVTDLLSVADTEAVFKFVHVLTERFEAIDAVAHFHLDPDAHDEQVVRTLERVVDEVFVEFEADEAALEFTGRSRRTSDADVAAAVGDPETVADGDDGNGAGEASDGDVEDALDDV